MSRFMTFALSGLTLLLATCACANNIQVNNLTLTANNEVEGSIRVRFDLSWENSWRTSSAPNNWDAAWIFVKYKDAATGEWHHARLHNDAGHTAPTGSTIATGLLSPGTAFSATTNWGVGVFQYRSADGTGTFVANGTELRWNYGQNGITYADIAEVQVFAVEMVYVSQSSFFVGDGAVVSISGQFRNGSTNTPLSITSEAALTLGGTANGNLANNNSTGMLNVADDFNNTVTQTLPAAFPKGFAGFYCMKYEITQQQYVDFLNTLTRMQQDTRTGADLAVGETSVTNQYVMSNNSTVINRNGIRCDGSMDANDPITFYCDLNANGTGGEANDGQWIACNYLSWADLAAYLDWSGLRPMTELEYEKACRGPEPRWPMNMPGAALALQMPPTSPTAVPSMRVAILLARTQCSTTIRTCQAPCGWACSQPAPLRGCKAVQPTAAAWS